MNDAEEVFSGLNVFPNPLFAENVNVSYENSSGGQIKITLLDATGKTLLILYSGKEAKAE